MRTVTQPVERLTVDASPMPHKNHTSGRTAPTFLMLRTEASAGKEISPVRRSRPGVLRVLRIAPVYFCNDRSRRPPPLKTCPPSL